MFKNRAVQVKLVNIKDSSETPLPIATFAPDPEKINILLKDQVRNAAIAVGAIMTLSMVLKTSHDIVFLAAAKKFS